MQHYERQGYFFNEEIINYYIDLGKKDCSIAKKFRVLIKFYHINKYELIIKQKWTVHFFINYFSSEHFCIYCDFDINWSVQFYLFIYLISKWKCS